jgi:subtilisin family serine protease
MKRILIVSAALLLMAGCDSFSTHDDASQIARGFAGHATSSSADIIEGHYIVVLSKQPAAQSAAAEAALESVTAALSRRAGASVNHLYRHALTGFAAELTDEQVDELRRDPRVLAIEQDGYIYLNSDGTAQEYPTWGLDRIDQREPLLDRAYAYHSTGTGVTAYILDSGIYFSHSDFGGRASLGHDFIVEHYPDYADPTQEPGEDCMGHGTHVAGTVGGTTYGVAKDVALISVRVFDCNGRTHRSLYMAAVDWITADAQDNDRHPAVVNMSFGFNAASDPDHASATELAILNSIDTGIHFVAAGGNHNADACDFTPARISGVLTAGASAIGDQRASFSNYGACVDLFAPGVSITSAWITDAWSGDGSYTRSLNGTSMSAPHVAGVVALYLQEHPQASPSAVFDAIVANSTPNAVSAVPSGTNSLLHSLWSSVDFTPPPLAELNLSTAGLKVQGKHAIDLTWDSPSGGSRVQIFRGESLIAQGWGYGSYRDKTNERGNDATYVHQVCQKDDQEYYLVRENCSEKVSTIFGSGGDDGNPDPPPSDGLTASFDYSCGNSPTCQFTDTSTEGGAAIVSRNWATGSQTDSGSPVSFTFGTAGDHVVMLTVTDAEEASDQISKTVKCSSHRVHGLRCS